MPSPSSVAERLELPEGLMPWLESLDQSGPSAAGLELPTGAAAVELLARLGVVEPDLSTILDALPDAHQQPEWWWLLERAAQQVKSSVGNWESMASMPPLPAALGAPGRCFWIYVFMAATHAVRTWHTRQGIDDDVSWNTLADLGRHIARYRRRNGITGLDVQWWFSLHYRGMLYELGRLQFSPFRLRTGPAGPLFWYEGDAAVARGPGFQVGDPVLGLHIPSGSPLLPTDCDASFGQAGPFFARHFPRQASRVVTCTSWLLDDQLADYLPPSSNIVQFQRRFELIPGVMDHDDEVLRWVFDRVPRSLDELSPQTELEHVLIRHVRNGGHWRMRTGWLLLS